jgi:hypothetical protein
VRDWVEKGEASEFVLTPDRIAPRLPPKSRCTIRPCSESWRRDSKSIVRRPRPSPTLRRRPDRTIRAETNRPIPEYILSVVGPRAPLQLRAGRVVASPDGAFEVFDLEHGQEYTIAIEAEGYAKLTLNTFASAYEADPRSISIPLRRDRR